MIGKAGLELSVRRERRGGGRACCVKYSTVSNIASGVDDSIKYVINGRRLRVQSSIRAATMPASHSERESLSDGTHTQTHEGEDVTWQVSSRG